MNPLKFAAATCVLLIASLITLASSKRVRNADTPVFYLVSSNETYPVVNLLVSDFPFFIISLYLFDAAPSTSL